MFSLTPKKLIISFKDIPEKILKKCFLTFSNIQRELACWKGRGYYSKNFFSEYKYLSEFSSIVKSLGGHMF